jgi:hypothetical protein
MFSYVLNIVSFNNMVCCSPLIVSDTAVELAWRNGYTDYFAIQPYMIQPFIRHLHDKLTVFEVRTAPPPAEDTSAADAAAALGYGLGMGMMGDQLMLTNAPAYGGGYGGGYGAQSSIPDPYQQQQVQQYGGGYQQQQYGGGGGYY